MARLNTLLDLLQKYLPIWFSRAKSFFLSHPKPLLKLSLIIFILAAFWRYFGSNFLPPQILYSFPDRDGSDIPLDTRIEIVFDRNIFPTQVTITPELEAEYVWEGSHRLIITPTSGLDRGVQYTLSFPRLVFSKYLIPGKLKPLQFTSLGHPKVILASPQSELPSDYSPVTVVFDRPMLSLTSATNSAVRPPAFTIDPPIKGSGRWLGTTSYQFTPQEPYRQATTYQVKLTQNLPSADGGILPNDYNWSFSSVRPKVVSVSPVRDYQYANPSASISALFSQNLVLDSVKSRFNVVDENNKSVPGRLVLSGRRVGFYPSQPLERGKLYKVTLASGIQSTEGTNGLEADYFWQFTTALPPEVLSSHPADNTVQLDYSSYSTILIDFKTPMSEKTLQNISIFPQPDRNFSVYLDWGQKNKARLYANLKPQTTYTVTVPVSVTDQYKTPLSKPFIFKFTTGKMLPSVSVFPSHLHFAAFNQVITPRIVSTVFGSGQVNYSLYRLSQKDFLQAFQKRYELSKFTYPQDSLVHSWSESIPEVPDTPYRMVTKVTASDGTNLPSGFYFVDIKLPTGQRDQLVMIVSKSVLTLKKSPNQVLVWAVDQSTGNTVPDMDLEIVNPGGTTISKGRTNQDGVWLADLENLPDSDTFVFGRTDQDQVVISQHWGDGISRYSFGLPFYSAGYRYSGSSTEPHQLFIQPDRPIYRPGQTVYFQGLVRKDRDGDFSLVSPDSEVVVTITDSHSRTVYNQSLKVDSFGSFSGHLLLSSESSTGTFQLKAVFAGNDFSQSFQVEEYRKPEVSVSVNLPKTTFVHGETLSATIQASYYFGAPVANAPVTWSLLTQDSGFHWAANWRYEFGNPDQYWSLPWWDYGQGYYYSGDAVTTGRGITDADGQLKINFPLNLDKYSAPQKMVLQAVVNDISNQSIAASGTFSVYKGGVFAGLSPHRYGGRQNEVQSVSVVTVDTQGLEVPRQPVSLSVYKRTWQSIRVQDPDTREYYYKSTSSDTLKFSQNLTTDDFGYAKFDFTPDSGGSYLVKAVTTDQSGKTNTTATYLWISGSEYSSARQSHDRINLIPGQPQYEIGQTASLFIDTPYATTSAKTLITMERGQVLDYQVIDVNELTNNISFTIKPNYSPNLYLSALLIRPGSTVGQPAEFKMGLTQISVVDKKKHLNIEINTDKFRYQPGDTAKIKLKVTDDTNSPVKTKLALGIVDQAVWDLSTANLADIHTVFYQPRGLNVQTSQLLTISMDRINLNTNLGAKGGSGGGGEDGGFDTSRKDFPDTAYWNPDIITNDQGLAELEVKLPDSLTTWRLVTTAHTTSSAFGSNFAKVIVTRDVLVRPFLPRFLSVGDQSFLGSIITNTTDSSQTVTANIAGTGLSLSDSSSQKKTILPGQSVKFTWKASVLATDSARLLLSLNTFGNYQDSASFTLPVQTYYTPEVVSTAGIVDPTAVESFTLPDDIVSGMGQLSLTLSNRLGSYQPEIINYLLDYSYYCAEQTSSKLLPFVYTHSVLGQQPHLADQVNALVQRLISLQHADGGWSWWQAGDSRPYLTAIVYQALSYQSRFATETTHPVDKAVLDRAVKYLVSQLSQTSTAVDDNTRAFILYVLRDSDQNLMAYAANLYNHPEKLNISAKAQLALSSQKMSGFSHRYRRLLSEIESLARRSSTTVHWEDYTSGNYFGSSITTTAQVLELLLSENPKHPYVSQVLRYLENAKTNGHFSTTRENASVILALSTLARSSQKSTPSQFRLSLNSQKFQEGAIDQSQVFNLPLSDLVQGKPNRLEISKSGSSPLFYNYNLKYFLPFAETEALDQGIVVIREFVDQKGNILPSKQIRENSEVRIRLTLVTPHTRRHVIIEDFLPAGIEAVNLNLKNVAVDRQTSPFEDYWNNMYYFGHTEFRDDRVVLFAEFLPAGIYQYTYRARATTPGTYHYPAATAYEMYTPDISGHSASGFLNIVSK